MDTTIQAASKSLLVLVGLLIATTTGQSAHAA